MNQDTQIRQGIQGIRSRRCLHVARLGIALWVCIQTIPSLAQPFPGSPELLGRQDLRVDDVFKRIADYKLGESREPLAFLAAKVAAASRDLAAPATRDLARRLTGLLDVPAEYECKDFALRQLLLIAGPEDVPAIAKRIDEPGLGHLAIAVLERMENPSADKALREQLLLLSKDSRIMTINALGHRRDVESVRLFKELLCDCEPDVAAATLAALGSIATDEARRLIETKKLATEQGVRFAALDALLRIALDLAANGKANEAAGICQNIFDDDMAFASLRSGALRGWVMTRPDRAVPRLVELLSSKDQQEQTLAVGVLRDLPAGYSKQVVDSFASFTPVAQARVLEMLALRRDPAGRPAAEAGLKSPDPQVRRAATDFLNPPR